MSDDFLKKLRQIRQKYGISDTQFRAAKLPNQNSFINTTKSTHTTHLIPQPPFNANKNKSPLSPCPDTIKESHTIEFKRRPYSRQAARLVNQNSRPKQGAIVNTRQKQRAYSQPKILPDNSYLTLDTDVVRPLRQPKFFQTKRLQRSPLVSSNIENLKLLYEPIAQPIPSVPSFSYARKPLQLTQTSASTYSIDKLCQVQQKISAFLRK